LIVYNTGISTTTGRFAGFEHGSPVNIGGTTV
jgi:hypothetical protein